MAICGSRYEHTNGITYICVEDPRHMIDHGTMHEADTLCNGPVNW
jgi:hypothetical protein